MKILRFKLKKNVFNVFSFCLNGWEMVLRECVYFSVNLLVGG